MERRNNTGTTVAVEKRSEGEGNTVTGYASVFFREGESGTEYRLFDGAVERIDPAAFSRALAEKDDVRGLMNHDSNMVLGRSSADTLRLYVDDVGLRYEIDLPDTTSGRDVAESIRRGDITGSSFSFEVESVEWEKQEEGDDIRHIRSVRLYDVGPVTYPAYQSSTAGVRSAYMEGRSVRQEWEAWRGERLRQSCAKRKRAVSITIGQKKIAIGEEKA